MDANDKVRKTANIKTWVKLGLGRTPWRIVDSVRKGVKVSTVFLGVDMKFGMKTPPELFETMIIGGKDNEKSRRYASKGEAERGHAETVKRMKE